MATSQDFVNWICSDVILPEWLMYLLIAEKESLLGFGRGTTHTTIYFPEVKALHVCLPPLNEQRRIAAKLESLQAHSQQAREALAAIPDLLERFRKSVLASAFRGDLTADWRQANPDVEPASVLLDRIRCERREHWEAAELEKMRAKGKAPKDDRWKQKYKAPEPVDSTELPELPDGWCWAAAEEIVEPGSDIVYGIVQPGKEVSGGVPYVRGKDIEGGCILVNQLRRTSPSIAERYARASLRGGDILLGIIRATKVAIVPDELAGANITQGTARFRPAKGVDTSVLAAWLDSPFAQAWLHAHYRGIDMPGLNLRDVRRLPIPLLPADEQAVLVPKVRSGVASAGRTRGLVQDVLSALDGLDASVLARAFIGGLVLQDPGDEPAEALLQRIKGDARADSEKPRNTQHKRRAKNRKHPVAKKE